MKREIMITRDGRDTPITKLTADNYIVPPGEERYYHAVIEVRHFSQTTGERLSKPRVQKFGRKAFENGIRRSLEQQGYTITILHDPKGYIAEKSARAAEERALRAEKEEERFQKAVAEAVAKELAKLQKAEPKAVKKTK